MNPVIEWWVLVRVIFLDMIQSSVENMCWSAMKMKFLLIICIFNQKCCWQWKKSGFFCCRNTLQTLWTKRCGFLRDLWEGGLGEVDVFTKNPREYTRKNTTKSWCRTGPQVLTCQDWSIRAGTTAAEPHRRRKHRTIAGHTALLHIYVLMIYHVNPHSKMYALESWTAYIG
jgi:hypothetical protein